MTLAMEGIRILDVTDAVSGPFTTMWLAGYGAEVIRIESMRHLGFREPGPNSRKHPDVLQKPEDLTGLAQMKGANLVTTGFARYSLDKLSVALNLTQPQAREIFKKLVAISDVVIDNLSFGIMARWGFDYDSLKKIKKDIIVASMPSLGQGIHEQWTTWGMNLLSYTGFARSWGHADTPMEDRAANSTYGDYLAGMATVSGVMAALFHRSKTGEGQYVEVCQAEATAGLLGTIYLDYFVNGRLSEPIGNRNPELAPYNCYHCKGDDAWCVIAVFNENDWNQLCQALDSPAWTQDPKFASMESRLKNLTELDHNLESWTKQKTPLQVTNILQSYGVAAGAVQNAEDLFYDPQLRGRGYMLELEVQQRGKIVFDAIPIHLAAGQKPSVKRAPLLGEHNDYVYRQLLGMSQEEIQQLTDSKVIY